MTRNAEISASAAAEDRSPENEALLHAAGRKSTWVSVAVNICLTLLQIVLGIFAKSQALVADGIHSLSDLVADFVVLLAGHHSRKDADDEHPYGHRRYENAASLVLGLLLLAVGVGMIVSAVRKFSEPDLIPRVHMVALWTALIALIAKESLFRYMLMVAKRVHSSMLAANAWHARSDAASSLVVAIGIVGNLMGYPILDPVAALIVGCLVTKMGWSFGWQAMQDLMDASADDAALARIRNIIAAQPGVLGVHDLRTRKMGDAILVDAHVEVDDRISVVEGHNIALKVHRALIAERDILDSMIHIDPVNAATGKNYDSLPERAVVQSD